MPSFRLDVALLQDRVLQRLWKISSVCKLQIHEVSRTVVIYERTGSSCIIHPQNKTTIAINYGFPTEANFLRFLRSWVQRVTQR